MGNIAINEVSEEILVSELGLSETVADRVIRMRAGRPFTSVEDLTEVDGIGEVTAERLSGLVVFAANTGTRAAAANAKEITDLDLDGIFKAKVTLGPDGKPEITGEFDLLKAITEIIKALGRSSKKDDDDDDDDKKEKLDLGELWHAWDAVDTGIATSPCPEDKKKRLRTLAVNIRNRLRALRSSLRAGDSEGAEQAASDIETWLREAKKILEDCQ